MAGPNPDKAPFGSPDDLRASSDLLGRALLMAPIDDEPDTDDEDGGLTEAREELARGEGLSTEELLAELGPAAT